MPRVWRELLGREGDRSQIPFGGGDMPWGWMKFGGINYPLTPNLTSPSQKQERPEGTFIGFVHGMYRACGPVFAVSMARASLFSEARFLWQRMRKGKPGDLFGHGSLANLERPWPNGTTGELLLRAEQDVTLAGNFYLANEGDRLRRLRPDWVQIVLTAPPAQAVKSDVLGYMYTPGGMNPFNSQPKPESVFYPPEEIAHWSPIPDPEAQYRGMSWLTPVITEVMADRASIAHELKFFENAATPNLAVSVKETVSLDQFKEYLAANVEAQAGLENAYKTAFFGGGADVTVVGKDLRQIAFAETMGANEVRVCAAGRCPPIVAGVSEGLRSSTYSNYQQAVRHFGDGFARPQWRSFCASVEQILPKLGSDTRLWYDDESIPMLREAAKDRADVHESQSRQIKALIEAGFKPKAAVEAVTTGDLSILDAPDAHTGMVSVQMQPITGTPPSGGGDGGGGPTEPPAPPSGNGNTQPALPAGK